MKSLGVVIYGRIRWSKKKSKVRYDFYGYKSSHIYGITSALMVLAILWINSPTGSSNHPHGFKRALTKVRIYLSKLPYSLSLKSRFDWFICTPFTHPKRVFVVWFYCCPCFLSHLFEGHIMFFGIFTIITPRFIHRPCDPCHFIGNRYGNRIEPFGFQQF